MRVLVDTNVLISALVFRRRPRELLIRLLEAGHEILVTSYIDREFYRILYQKWPQTAYTVYHYYRQLPFSFQKSTDKKLGSLRDAKDIPVLSDAIFYHVDVILTGDRDFLEAGLTHPAALSPSTLWERLEREASSAADSQ